MCCCQAVTPRLLLLVSQFEALGSRTCPELLMGSLVTHWRFTPHLSIAQCVVNAAVLRARRFDDGELYGRSEKRRRRRMVSSHRGSDEWCVD